MTTPKEREEIDLEALAGLRVIWSNEHSAWWAPNRCGYSSHVFGAGLYNNAEAEEICKHIGPGRPDEVHYDAAAQWRHAVRAAHHTGLLRTVLRQSQQAPAQDTSQARRDALEEAAQIAEGFTRDASFDDSMAGAVEHNSNQANIAMAIRALAQQDPPAREVQHASDCAVHNGPALDPGPCDCSVALGASESPPLSNHEAGAARSDAPALSIHSPEHRVAREEFARRMRHENATLRSRLDALLKAVEPFEEEANYSRDALPSNRFLCVGKQDTAFTYGDLRALASAAADARLLREAGGEEQSNG